YRGRVADMARRFCIKEDSDSIGKMLTKAFQSANINFLIGSGASYPAIAPAGLVEQEIEALFAEGKIEEANKRMYEFLAGIQGPTNLLLKKQENENNNTAIENYKSLIRVIEEILMARKTSLLPKQAKIFTTNYDLLIERAAEAFPALRFNDGFNRVPSLDNRFVFSPPNFFNSTLNFGNLYNYTVEIPVLNLIKIHGSLSWKKEHDEVLFNVCTREDLPEGSSEEEIQNYNGQFAVVLPQKTKFQQTLMDRVYYDLLRIYSNELDKENTVLIVFGFSFVDEHIYDITKRALKNPALKLEIFSYSHDEISIFINKFDGYNNVDVIGPPEGECIDFTRFSATIDCLSPKPEEK
ncbi:MAG: SIR2 family protein, partial [Anaerolineae bacterium]|nr:SIR2 family protein [Anaerolineae bacterium]